MPHTLSAARDKADLKVGLYGVRAPVAVTSFAGLRRGIAGHGMCRTIAGPIAVAIRSGSRFQTSIAS
jgi:hypothetical protein